MREQTFLQKLQKKYTKTDQEFGMIERIPPHNEEAERSVLGAAMLNKEVLFDILEEVKEDDFYNESHKEIFRAIWELYRKNSAVDMLTVCEELKSRQ